MYENLILEEKKEVMNKLPEIPENIRNERFCKVFLIELPKNQMVF